VIIIIIIIIIINSGVFIYFFNRLLPTSTNFIRVSFQNKSVEILTLNNFFLDTSRSSYYRRYALKFLRRKISPSFANKKPLI